MPNPSSYQPALALQRAVQTKGAYAPNNGGGGDTGAVIGTIHTYAWGSAGGGVAANGALLPLQQQYYAIFSEIGVAYGGNGNTNFAVPNLGGRISIGSGVAGASVGVAAGASTVTVSAQDQSAWASHTAATVAEVEPSLTTTFVINTQGQSPSSNYEPTYDTIGMISQFAGNYPPAGTISCDGRLLPISQYTSLYALLGTTYGGDGATTFAVPDLRGRTIVGVDGSHQVGEVYGGTSHDLNAYNLPSFMGGYYGVDNDAPSVVMHYFVATNGVYPDPNTNTLPDAQEPYLGEVLIYAGLNLPDGYVDARGQSLSIADNPQLFNLIGTTYGGDGQTTFDLPDLGGRTVVGTGTAPDGSNLVLGETLGSDVAYFGIDTFGQLTVVGTAADDTRIGANQADTISGLAGNDALIGYGGDDRLIGGAGADYLYGGTGTNTASYETATTGVIADLADTSLNAGDADGDRYYSIQNLIGSAHNDYLVGDGGANRLEGGAGDDVLEGGAGADILVGGAGINAASYAMATDGVHASLTSPGQNTGDAQGDTYQDISRLNGSTFADMLTGSSGNDILAGGGGTDTLVGLGGDDKLFISGTPLSVDGGAGTDTLTLTANSSAAIGDGVIVGIERINVNAGATLDLSQVAATVAPIYVSNAAGSAVTTVTGTQGADRITQGGAANDVLNGGGGNDVIIVTHGFGSVDGGAGNDVLQVQNGASVTIAAGSLTGVETVRIGADATVDAHAVQSTGLVFQLSSTAGHGDQVTGTAGDDRIRGGAGEDTINGGAGADQLVGGAGADVFSFNGAADAIVAGDRITDFEHGAYGTGDRIDISAIYGAGATTPYHFVVVSSFYKNGVDEARLSPRANGNTYVQFDVDHDGKADFSFLVHSDIGLSVADFITDPVSSALPTVSSAATVASATATSAALAPVAASLPAPAAAFETALTHDYAAIFLHHGEISHGLPALVLHADLVAY